MTHLEEMVQISNRVNDKAVEKNLAFAMTGGNYGFVFNVKGAYERMEMFKGTVEECEKFIANYKIKEV